jgi:hypothetical protein
MLLVSLSAFDCIHDRDGQALRVDGRSQRHSVAPQLSALLAVSALRIAYGTMQCVTTGIRHSRLTFNVDSTSSKAQRTGKPQAHGGDGCRYEGSDHVHYSMPIMN